MSCALHLDQGFGEGDQIVPTWPAGRRWRQGPGYSGGINRKAKMDQFCQNGINMEKWEQQKTDSSAPCFGSFSLCVQAGWRFFAKDTLTWTNCLTRTYSTYFIRTVMGCMF